MGQKKEKGENSGAWSLRNKTSETHTLWAEEEQGRSLFLADPLGQGSLTKIRKQVDGCGRERPCTQDALTASPLVFLCFSSACLSAAEEDEEGEEGRREEGLPSDPQPCVLRWLVGSPPRGSPEGTGDFFVTRWPRLTSQGDGG